MHRKTRPQGCPNCTFNQADEGKYKAVYVKRKKRIRLDQTTASLSSCPKCGFSVPWKGFVRPKEMKKEEAKLKEESRRRVEKLKRQYQPPFLGEFHG